MFDEVGANSLAFSLAWLELYVAVARLVDQFDFDFHGAGPEHVDWAFDNFVIGVADSSGLKATATARAQ